MKTYVNGKLDDRVSVFDRGLQYGDGLFETMRIANARIPLLNEHLNRLTKGCQRLKIEIEDYDLIKREVNNLAQDYTDAIIKLIITRGVAQRRGYAPQTTGGATRIIYISETESLFAQPADKPPLLPQIRLMLCKTPLSRNQYLAGIKHLNRLENVLAAQECAQLGFDEGIVLDDLGRVIECTHANIFYIKNNRLCTPDLSDCGVNGILREKVMAIALQKLALPTQVEALDLNSLLHADEIFICNSVMGIKAVVAIEDRQYALGELTQRIREQVLELYK